MRTTLLHSFRSSRCGLSMEVWWLVVRSSAAWRRVYRAAASFCLLLTCMSTSTAAQSAAIDDDEVFAIYKALLRDPNVGVRAFSSRPVMLRRETANMGFYMSARLFDWSILPEDIQRALRNPVGSMALPNKLADEPGIS